jgi:hypothetical protein
LGLAAVASATWLAACGAEAPTQPGKEIPVVTAHDVDGSASASAKEPKVTICHKGRETITVAQSAVPAHQAHGDTLGACGTSTGPSPSPSGSPSPSPSPSGSPSPSPTPSPTGACNGLGATYWASWRAFYTDAQFATLLAGTIATSAGQADQILAPGGCGGPNVTNCVRRALLAVQLSVNLAANPALPNPQGGGLSLSCSAPGVQGTLGDWIVAAQAYLANPASLTQVQASQMVQALEAFAAN